MTGVTTLKAPNQWTSFIEAKDNEDIKSNVSADYNASTDDAVRQQNQDMFNSSLNPNR